MATIDGQEIASTDVRHTQVYVATHDGAGNYLPYMNRSFISFSYGGKNIEDFNLLAIIEGDALQRQLYAEFEDNVTEASVWDGQIYWSSHFNAYTLTMALFTDEIEDKLLTAFKQWFRPGRIEELILSENPNRAILARVAEAPIMSMIPFEHKIETSVAGQIYQTSTTVYRGKIELSFVMDEPFWYSKAHLLDKVEPNNLYKNGYWIDANQNEAVIIEDKDAVKILHEDGIPTVSMVMDEPSDKDDIENPMLFGTDKSFDPDKQPTDDGCLTDYARTETEQEEVQGHTALEIRYYQDEWDLHSSFIDYPAGNDDVRSCGYFYYAGNAPSKPKLTFTLAPEFQDSYVSVPRNTYTDSESSAFNVIALQGIGKKYFLFTTPSVYSGYNQAIKIFRDIQLIGAAWEEVRVALRDNIKHWAPRAYAMGCINKCKTGIQATALDLNHCAKEMENFLKNKYDEVLPATYVIDSESGTATATITYRKIDDTVITSVENVGDMILSNYLIIEETNHPTDEGYISIWTFEHPEYSHRIYADCDLTDVKLEYRYMYL